MTANPLAELPIARDTRTAVTVAGGGLAGLVAAISLAERRARVTLHEARGRLGGRGDSTAGPHRANLGPHALYCHGPLEAWLRAQGLLPPLAFRFNLVTPAISVVIVFVLFPRLRRLARRDPHLFAALPGHLRHAGFYPVRVHHARPRPRARRTL